MARLRIDLPDWRVDDFLYAHAYKITNLHQPGFFGGSVFNGCFGSSPGSFSFASPPYTFMLDPGLFFFGGIYAPGGSPPGAINWTGGLPVGAEQDSVDTLTEAHLGWRFDYTASPWSGLFGMNWSPGNQLQWAVSRFTTVGVPVITSLGAAQLSPGPFPWRLPIADPVGWDYDNDVMAIYYVYAGSRGQLFPKVTLLDYPSASATIFFDGQETLPPFGYGSGPMALLRSTGHCIDPKHNDVISGQFLFVKLQPLATHFAHHFKAHQ